MCHLDEVDGFAFSVRAVHNDEEWFRGSELRLQRLERCLRAILET